MTEILVNSIARQKCRNNFKNHLYVVFKHINLPSPTKIQYAIADELQYGDTDTVIEGFRGVAKSTITGIYASWLLDRDPENCQILNVSANQTEACKFMKFTRSLLDVVPFLNYLRPDLSRNQRDSALQFDVAPAETRIQPSVKALGIFGQLTGNRATDIIADDIETSENCKSQIERDKIEAAVTEFRQILIPKVGRLIYLGTPHTELSIYNKLYDKGHKVRIFPIKYPTPQQQEKYGDKLAPYIVEQLEQDPTLVDMPTDPIRFDENEIIKLESEGRSKFAMQQMLDTTLSDLERYPLKCSDLIVMDCDKEIAPEKVAYGSAPNQILKDIPCNGIGTDKYYAPIPIPDIKWKKYTYKVMTIDPSGRGKDELAYSLGGVLNSYISLLKQGGLQGGYSTENLYFLANLAKDYKVNKIKIESNFGDGMFTALFLPILKKVGYQCEVEEIRHNTQKEKRIIDTLEPVMNQHRLIVDKSVIKEDAESIKIYPLEHQQRYSLFYQMTRITKDRGCLSHDDRLDCLAMLVADCLEMMSIDADEQIQQRLDDEYEEYIQFVFGDIDSNDEKGWFEL
jgi:hypothetical protein